MDWAVNPLAALFFASENVTPTDRPLDGVVWCMEIKKFTERDRGGLLHLEKIPFHLDRGRIDPHTAVELLEIAKISETGALVDGDPKVIVPRIITRRIEAQAGRFLAYSEPIRANHIPTSSDKVAWKRIIPLAIIEDKERIISELSALRIHHGSIYADIDSYGKFLSDGRL